MVDDSPKLCNMKPPPFPIKIRTTIDMGNWPTNHPIRRMPMLLFSDTRVGLSRITQYNPDRPSSTAIIKDLVFALNTTCKANPKSACFANSTSSVAERQAPLSQKHSAGALPMHADSIVCMELSRV